MSLNYDWQYPNKIETGSERNLIFAGKESPLNLFPKEAYDITMSIRTVAFRSSG
jgi:hypothetical protein